MSIMNPTSEDRLEQMRSLIRDYSFPERRTEEGLTKMDELLGWASAEFIFTGIPVRDIEEIFGSPYIAMGEAGENSRAWLYPCLAPEGKKVKSKSETEWFIQLNFTDGKLSSVEKRQWHFAKE